MYETISMVEAMKVPAEHLTESFRDLAEWCGGAVSSEGATPTIRVRTNDGVAEAAPGDYLIKDRSGSFHVRTASQYAEAYPLAAPVAPAPAPSPAPLPAPPAYDPFRR